MSTDYEPLVFALLNADATLTTLLTGGLYASLTLPPEGINRTTVPAAYDSNGWLKPICTVRGRDVIATGLKDRRAKTETQRQAIEIYIQQDADSGFSTLLTIYARVHTLLEQARVTRGKGQRTGNLQRYFDEGMNGVATIRAEYSFVGVSD